MNQLKFFTLGFLLATSIVSCKKNKPQPPQILKYAGVATTFKSQILRENGTETHMMTRDTLDFELTVIIEGKTIQFLSANDSIVKSGTFKITDSIAKNNTYSSPVRGFSNPNTGDWSYVLKNDSLNYSYDYYMYGTINSYNVKFAGIKQ